ncbi:acylphosphatase [Trichoderma parareesei]|uniref:acylphosphatase n=1 Tax=Trichoderma parareesei TaxID=858221 RepID=A0A2H2ZT74_TRIPA|nr:acylphosphatase [Trichoderma parareesei]
MIEPDVAAHMLLQVYFEVHGFVQGVGFRYFTRKKAQEYGVTGWCRNTVNDTVEGEAQGSEDVMQKFFDAIGKGPSHSNVTKVVKEDRDVVDGDSSFEVRR